MKRKIIALIAALAVGGSVTAYAATAFNQTPADAATTGTVKCAATVCTSAKPASSAVQAVLSKASTNACKNTSAVSAAKSQTCKGGNCATKSACTANSCTNGTSCSKGNCTASANCGTAAATQSCTKGTSACSGNTACSNSAACNGNTACTAGTNCGNAYVCNGSGCSYSNLLNSILNACGKPCSGASCSSAKNTASKPASSAPASSSSYSAFQNEVVKLVNSERAKNGRTALTADAALMKTATLKSQDMVKNNYFSHTSPTYGSPFDLMKKYGISFHAAGENIAMGQTSPSQVMSAWMNSAGHRANILSASYTKIGVGVAQNSSGTYYWTQHFIG